MRRKGWIERTITPRFWPFFVGPFFLKSWLKQAERLQAWRFDDFFEQKMGTTFKITKCLTKDYPNFGLRMFSLRLKKGTVPRSQGGS